MILERSREFTINMGNYESCKIGARIVVDTDQLTEDKDLAPKELYTLLDAMLTEATQEDLNEAKELTHTRDSFVLSWKS